MIMYAAAMGNAITAVFQCLSAISVNGFLTPSLRRFLLVAFLYLTQMFVYCIIKFPKVAEAIPQSCRGNFPNNAAVFGASLSLLGW